MPGFFITNIESQDSFELNNYCQEKCIRDEIQFKNVTVKRNILNAFTKDKIFFENNQYILLTDGVIFDTEKLLDQTKTSDIKDALLSIAENEEKFFESINGHCSGALYYKNEDKWVIFTNPLGDRAIFYYYNNGEYIIGSQLNYVTDYMKLVGISRNVDRHGISCLMDFGYFIDNSTCIKNIKRLYPGEYLVINESACITRQYYIAEFEEKAISLEDAIESLDTAFCRAVKRIADKNLEYGYKNLLDISGGLDSRIICYTMKRLGYNNSIMITYSQSNSHEEKITKSISQKLDFELYHKILDNGKCIKDIDELVFMNSGVSYYYGITGGKDFLEVLDNRILGMEFTGVLGDIYDGSMLTENGLSKPTIESDKYRASKLNSIDKKNSYSTYINKFKKNDTFWLYTRGMLAGLSTFLIRQNFIEPVTPFGDKDFLRCYLSIPWEMRVKDRVLFKWFLNKYPSAAQIRYAATGLKPINHSSKFSKVKYRLLLYIKKGWSLLQGKPLPNNMNPVKFWLKANEDLIPYIDNYFYTEMEACSLSQEIKSKLYSLYNDNSDFNNKAVALTVVAYSKLFIK